MARINMLGMWRYVSSYLNTLSDATHDLWEWFWEGIAMATFSMKDAAFRFIESSNPETSRTSPSVDWYDIEIDLNSAAKMLIDPTDVGSRTSIIVLSTIKGITRNKVEISGSDYKMIRGSDTIPIPVGKHALIQFDDSPVMHFIIEGMEIIDEFGLNPAYLVVLRDANLPIINHQKVVLSITDGKSYKVGDDVLDVNEIRVNITDGARTTQNIKNIFKKDIDFKFSNNTVEFIEDIVGLGYVDNGQVIYGVSVPVIESNLFRIFGPLVGISDWRAYAFDNINGKAAINSLVMASQRTSEKSMRILAFNAYYGLPICPDTATVLGLYESYDYTIDDVDGDIITIYLEINMVLHPFVCPGAKLFCYEKGLEFDVVSVDAEEGVVTLASATGLVAGDLLNVRLNNRMKNLKLFKPALSSTRLGTDHWTDGSDLQHIATILDPNRHEVTIFDTGNVDGVYHMAAADLATYASPTHMVNIKLCDYASPVVDSPYNDFIPVPSDIESAVGGFSHIPWPTHKYLLVRFVDGTRYRMYMDAPVDTIFDKGDNLQKYQPICSCLDVMNEKDFPYWNQYDGFPRSNGIDLKSSIIEVMATIPNTKFGSYFPVV